MMEEELPEIVTPPCSFPRSKRSCRTRPVLEESNSEETCEGAPHKPKKRNTPAGRMKDKWEAMAQVPQMVKPTESPLHKAKKRVDPITTTPVPPTERPNCTIHVKSEPPNDHDLVDFRGLAMVPRCYASLLERACISYPDLAICPKRSLRWREFAYTTLGELLFFLTSKRHREMTDKALEHLQLLWEEAQGLGFDLSWLEHSMMSVLGASSILETISQLQTEKEGLKERKNSLHCQLTTLTMQMIEVENGLAALDNVIQHGDRMLDRFLYTGL